MTSFLNATPILSYRILSLLYSLILSLLIISLKKNFTSVQLFPFNRALYLQTIRIYLKPLASPLIPNIQIIFNPILARYRYRLDQKNFQKKISHGISANSKYPNFFIPFSVNIDRVGKISKKRSREILITWEEVRQPRETPRNSCND